MTRADAARHDIQREICARKRHAAACCRRYDTRRYCVFATPDAHDELTRLAILMPSVADSADVRARHRGVIALRCRRLSLRLFFYAPFTPSIYRRRCCRAVAVAFRERADDERRRCRCVKSATAPSRPQRRDSMHCFAHAYAIYALPATLPYCLPRCPHALFPVAHASMPAAALHDIFKMRTSLLRAFARATRLLLMLRAYMVLPSFLHLKTWHETHTDEDDDRGERQT